MNYEKFNDAMVRLKQAQDDMNKALGDIFVAVGSNKGPTYGPAVEDKENNE